MTPSAAATHAYVGPALSRPGSTTLAKLKLAAAPKRVWPRNVPELADAVTLMFDPARLPEPLREPTLLLMRVFTAQHLSECPPGVDFTRWVRALATVFRLQAAATLAGQADTHDEPSLQAMFGEAAEARDWLLELTFDALFESTAQALALRGLLQSSWDEVLKSAPSPAEPTVPRPPAHTGDTGIRRMPAAPVKKKDATLSAYRIPPRQTAGSSKRVMLGLTLAASLLLLVGFGPRRTEVYGGGAPKGWILAGSLDPGPATVISATAVAPPRGELEVWLQGLRAQGVHVAPHGKDEWLLTR